MHRAYQILVDYSLDISKGPIPFEAFKEVAKAIHEEYNPGVPAGFYQKIIEYLNSKTESKWKYTSNKTRELIKARYNEGFRYEDFVKVIDNCVAKWSGQIWNRNDGSVVKGDDYLRPSTLFNNKFENRLNIGVTEKKTSKIARIQ